MNNRHQLRKAVNSLIISSLEIENCYGVTLTLKQSALLPGPGNRYANVPLTAEAASQNLRHFLNQLRRRYYGRQRQLKVAAAFESDSSTRMHFHLIVEKPSDVSEVEFESDIQRLWPRTTWGNKITHVQPCDVGWVNYMTKFRTKEEFDLGIDILNTHF